MSAECKGGDPPIEKSRDEAVSKYGEPGLIRYLAARDKVPVRSLDPTRAEEIAFLFKRFSPEQVKLFFILRIVAQHKQRQRTSSIEQELERVFPIFAATPGLNISPNSIVELESSYNRYFSERGSFKEVQMTWFDPTISENLLNEIARRSSEYRAVILKTSERCAVTEEERLQAQALFPRSKVFSMRFQCDEKEAVARRPTSRRSGRRPPTSRPAPLRFIVRRQI